MSFIYHDDDGIQAEEKVERVYHITSPSIPHDWIAMAAYYHWERRGRPYGSHWVDWLAAEKELHERLQQKKDTAPAPAPPPTREEPPGHSWMA